MFIACAKFYRHGKVLGGEKRHLLSGVGAILAGVSGRQEVVAHAGEDEANRCTSPPARSCLRASVLKEEGTSREGATPEDTSTVKYEKISFPVRGDSTQALNWE